MDNYINKKSEKINNYGDIIKQNAFFEEKYLLSDFAKENINKIREEGKEILANESISLKERDKKYMKKISETRKFRNKYKKNKDDMLKYYKILYLGNRGVGYILGKIRRDYVLDTGADMYEAEKILINNNWDLEQSIKDIKYAKGTLSDFEFDNNDFIIFKGFFDKKQVTNDSIAFFILSLICFAFVGVVSWLAMEGII